MNLLDLAAQRDRIGGALEARLRDVMEHGQFIAGPEVRELEEALADYSGVRHVVTCGNGTDALRLALMACGIGGGDAVFCPSFTFAATAGAVAASGAAPFFIDVDGTSFNMDVESLHRAVRAAGAEGLRPAGVIPVDLFGRPAAHGAIAAAAREHGLRVIVDSAQGFGARRNGRMTVTEGHAATTSFFPAKPLGCYGDGGAVFTDDAEIATLVRSLAAHGRGAEKYHSIRPGLNSRLDTMQAAILLEKLAVFDEEARARERLARRYGAALAGRYGVPAHEAGCRSVWAQYVLLARDGADRCRALDALAAAGIPAAIHYPVPLHRQEAFRTCHGDPDGLCVSESLSRRAFSIPLHAYLGRCDQDRVIDTLLAVDRRMTGNERGRRCVKS